MKDEIGELLEGAGDIHVHTSPSLVPQRKSDIWKLAEACEKHKMAFAVVKWHHGDSYSTAGAFNQIHDGPFQLFGGLVLNMPVGGLNPFAVDCAVAMGAKIVWLPTLDAEGHFNAIGGLGGFPSMKMSRTRFPKSGISILDSSGGLKEEMKEILSLLDRSETLLASGHVTPEEIYFLKEYLCKNRLDVHLLVNHIDFPVPDLSADDVKQLTSSKVWFELSYITLTALGNSSIEKMMDLIRKNPSAQFVLSSDSGQPQNPISPEALLFLAEAFLESGMPKPQLRSMLHANLTSLLKLQQAFKV